jgi:hypothetical protein
MIEVGHRRTSVVEYSRELKSKYFRAQDRVFPEVEVDSTTKECRTRWLVCTARLSLTISLVYCLIV